jgi:hypothetical protein
MRDAGMKVSASPLTSMMFAVLLGGYADEPANARFAGDPDRSPAAFHHGVAPRRNPMPAGNGRPGVATGPGRDIETVKYA